MILKELFRQEALEEGNTYNQISTLSIIRIPSLEPLRQPMAETTKLLLNWWIYFLEIFEERLEQRQAMRYWGKEIK